MIRASRHSGGELCAASPPLPSRSAFRPVNWVADNVTNIKLAQEHNRSGNSQCKGRINAGPSPYKVASELNSPFRPKVFRTPLSLLFPLSPYLCIFHFPVIISFLLHCISYAPVLFLIFPLSFYSFYFYSSFILPHPSP
jgi:hypothetical protein